MKTKPIGMLFAASLLVMLAAGRQVAGAEPAKPDTAVQDAPPPPGHLESAYERAEQRLSEAETNAEKTLQEQWLDRADPLVSPDAVPGGKITYAAASPPASRSTT